MTAPQKERSPANAGAKITPDQCASPGLEKAQWVNIVAGQHALGLLVMIQRQLMGFATNTGLLIPTESGMGGIRVVAVDPDPAGLNVATHTVSHIGITRPDTCTQAKLGIVGDGQRFFLGFEGRYPHNRAEDLFLEHPHLVIALKQRGLDVEAVSKFTFQVLAAATGENFSAFLLANLKVRQNLVELFFAG